MILRNVSNIFYMWKFLFQVLEMFKTLHKIIVKCNFN